MAWVGKTREHFWARRVHDFSARELARPPSMRLQWLCKCRAAAQTPDPAVRVLPGCAGDFAGSFGSREGRGTSCLKREYLDLQTECFTWEPSKMVRSRSPRPPGILVCAGRGRRGMTETSAQQGPLDHAASGRLSAQKQDSEESALVSFQWGIFFF